MMATNVLGLMDYVQQQGEKGRERGTQSRLASLASQAYGAQGEQRNALVGQAIATDPNAGFALGDKLQSRESDKRQKLGGAAKYMLGAVESQNPAQIQGAWNAVRPFLAELTGKDVPGEWSQDMLPALHQAIAMTGAPQAQEQYTLSPGAARYGANGELIAQQPFAPAKPSYRWTDQGLVAVTGDGATPVQYGGQQAAPQGQPGMTQVQYATDDGQPIPANEQAAAQAAFAASARGESFDFPANGPFPQAPQGGGRVMPAPKVGGAQFVQLNSDEIAAMNLPAGTVAQRNLTTGAVDIINKPPASAGAKPMPVSALRLLQDSREKLSIAQGNIDSLSKIGQQIASGDLNLGMLANAASRARNLTNNSTPESRNFALMMSSLEKLRNDSLRLNNGVQTEGDAQRAWNELMNNLNDEAVVSAQIVRIIGLNKRAERLHQESMESVNANYGAGMQAGQEQEAANNIESLLEMYN